MGLWRREKRAPDRAALLAATPLRRPDVAERALADGGLELTASLPKNRLTRWLSRSNAPVVRRFELDRLGAEAWRMMDGQTPVRAMIERFAASHQLNLREAEVAMLAYLRTLAQRGIMLLTWSEGGDDDHSTDRIGSSHSREA
jgi:hypothetical protein